MSTIDKSKWILASKRLPTRDEMAAFRGCECILQCTGSHDGQIFRFAYPQFLGNTGRFIWTDAEAKGGLPIENSSWIVTHWRPFPDFPKPIKFPAKGGAA